jgi:DNA polymerase
MNALAALRLQIEWGADEALAPEPVDRRHAAPPLAAPPVHAAPPEAPATRRGGAEARAAALAAAAATPEALREALAAFDGCALRDTATHLVFEDGNPDAGLMLIGEAPGVDDDREGRPFSGPDGAFLDRMLASIGLDRSALLIAMLVPWRPPGGRPPTAAEVALCLPFARRHLALRAPRRLVLVGPLAARAVLGAARRRRPAWTEASVPGLDRSLPALTLPHPATSRTSGELKRDSWTALRLLARALEADKAAMLTGS